MPNNSGHLPKSAYLQLNRKHVLNGARWGIEAGTDFWLMGGAVAQSGAAGTTSLEELAEFGWTATSLVDTAGSGADFISSADKGVPNHFLTNATGDLLASPAVFGDWAHAEQARLIAGMRILPTELVCEFVAAMTVHSADEPTSGWGLFEDGATISTEADQLAVISSDSANFQLAANGGAGALTDAGAADDALWHTFKIRLVVAEALAYWYIDGTVQGSVAITADEAPYKFGMHALTTNRPALAWVHIYYQW